MVEPLKQMPSPEELEQMKAANTLANFAAGKTLRDATKLSDITSGVSDIATALSTFLDFPDQDDTQHRYVLPALDGTYDVNEIVQHEIPIQVLMAERQRNHIELTSATVVDDRGTQDYRITIPLVPPEQYVTADDDMTTVDYRNHEERHFLPILDSEEDVKEYTGLLRNAVQGILLNARNQQLVDTYIETQRQRHLPDFEDMYGEIWKRMLEVAYSPIDLTSPSEIADFNESVAKDMQNMLEQAGIALDINAKAPKTLESRKTGANGTKNRVMFYRLPDRLVLIGGAVDEKGEGDCRYVLYIPVDRSTDEMHAKDFINDGSYRTSGPYRDARDIGVYFRVVQTAIKDLLSIVPQPQEAISL